MAVAVSAAEDAGVGQVGEDDPAVCQMVLGSVISEYHGLPELHEPRKLAV